jgi:NAD(P)-dependent dehydrogenase (short-subunit alcohol dehydrogenase family)
VKSILVSGAGSSIGRSLVRVLLGRRDRKIFATSRSEERLQQLGQTVPADARKRFVPIAGDAGHFDGASSIAARVETLGGIDGAVAIFGRGVWTSGPLLELPTDQWHPVLDEMLTAHFAFARAVFPLLSQRSDSMYVSLGGGAALGPLHDAGLMSIAAAGQMMLTRILDRERSPDDPRVIELIVNAAVGPGEPDDGSAISADDVANVIDELISDGGTTWPSAVTNGPLIVMNPESRAQ